MLDEIIDLVFETTNEAHLRHLVTGNHAEHVALGEFYNSARETLDKFVEVAIGLDVTPPEAVTADAQISRLEAAMVDLAESRAGACQDNPTLLAIHDELTGVYAKALYMLKRFK